MLYLDSSALVKVVLPESESVEMRALLGSGLVVATSALATVEVVRAVKRARPDLTTVARLVLAQTALISVDDAVLAQAGILEPATLRSLDAIHLASALLIRDELEAFVAYDARLLEAAASLGLPVMSPGA